MLSQISGILNFDWLMICLADLGDHHSFPMILELFQVELVFHVTLIEEFDYFLEEHEVELRLCLQYRASKVELQLRHMIRSNQKSRWGSHGLSIQTESYVGLWFRYPMRYFLGRRWHGRRQDDFSKVEE